MKQLGGCVWRIMYKGIQERNCIVAVQRLEGLGGTMNKGFVPYVTKKKTRATYTGT
jgi:hypothetical protein